MRKIIISFDKYPDGGLLVKAKEIQAKMTGNANFQNPTVPLATVDDTVADYEVALTDSASRDKYAIVHKNALRLTLTDMLRSNGTYVNSIAAGDLEKLVGSGYTPAKVAQPTNLEPPVIKKVMQGENPGEAILKLKGQKAAKSWEFQVRKDSLGEDAPWVSFISSRSYFLFTSLEQGEKYSFKAVAIGSNNQRTYCEPVSLFVQQYSIKNAA